MKEKLCDLATPHVDTSPAIKVAEVEACAGGNFDFIDSIGNFFTAADPF